MSSLVSLLYKTVVGTIFLLRVNLRLICSILRASITSLLDELKWLVRGGSLVDCRSVTHLGDELRRFVRGEDLIDSRHVFNRVLLGPVLVQNPALQLLDELRIVDQRGTCFGPLHDNCI